MRSMFVLTTVALALALGIVGAASESRVLLRALIVGFVPVMWGVSLLFERLTGRDMWHFHAPYPYRWMREEGDTARRRPTSPGKPVEDSTERDERSALPLAA